MKRLILCATATALALFALAPAAQADFGFSRLEATLTDSVGAPVTQAGSHPHAFATDLVFNTVPAPPGASADVLPEEDLKDLAVELPAGFIGNPTAFPTCPNEKFFGIDDGDASLDCPDSSAVGIAEVAISDPGNVEEYPVYSLTPSPGQAAKFAFNVIAGPVFLEVTVSPNPPYRIITRFDDAYQHVPLFSSKVTIWGVPADPAHDTERGRCAFGGSTCPAGVPPRAFLTLPRSCPGTDLDFPFEIVSWQRPQTVVKDSATAAAMIDCASLDFDPDVSAAPTTSLAAAPSGFDFSIGVDDPGLTDPLQRAESDLKRAVVTLPEGLTVNPSSADGLAACSEAQLAEETFASDFGEGCPAASKVASVDVQTPLLAERVEGSVFLATPYENPFGSLLAGYLVIKQPQRGVAIKLAGKIDADPDTGRLVASFDENPQLPFSALDVNFKVGNRAPLITPRSCGTYEVRTDLYPWSGNPPLAEIDSFTIDKGPDGGPCRAGDAARAGSPADEAALPNAPSFDAGTVSPISKAHSPFVVNLRRGDGSQRFAAVAVRPPPGLVAKLAGVPACPDAALAAAAAKSGQEEKANPSCPLASRVGTVVAGAGAGPTPYHATGVAYLSGPYKGAPLSLATVIPATAGPFDLGTVVTRVAAHVDPRTAEITAVSDPIPQILQGIPLEVRSVHVALDRPDFTLTGTSCDPMGASGQLTSVFGSIAELFSRFQLSDCTRLGFKPKMTLRLKGATKRGGHPQLTAVLAPRPGDANIRSVSVAFPRSEFLENAHIRTVCTRPDFAADACPAGAVYGTSTVMTPLLDYPLSGNVYLRSSDNLLPDLVPDLRGPAHQPLRVEAAGRTDSIRGGIRNTFDFFPDAPFTRAVLRMQGGSKGLLVNSRDICRRTYRAKVRFTAHNGDTYVTKPKMQARCKKRGKGKKKGKRGGHGRGAKKNSAVAQRSAVR